LAATPEASLAAAAASPRTPAAKPRTSEERPAASRPFIKTAAGLAVIGILLIVLGSGAFLYTKFEKEKKAALAAQIQAEQQAKIDREARSKAEQQAKAEAEARKRAEEEIAQKNAAAEAARRQAAEEAKRLEAENQRLLNGRGSLVIVTEPAGASVAISNFLPRISPVTINDLRLGRYTVNITLPDYDPLNLEVEIKENAMTDPGVIHLVRQVGLLEITTDPPGISFEVRPAPPRSATGGADVRQGKTPATLAGLPTGDYVVTFQRQGWPGHTENATVERGKTAHVTSKFPGGSVTITSTPGGANVIRDGATLGQTPLTLNDLQPGEVTYSLDLSGFIPTTVTGQIEPEKVLELNGIMKAADRIFRPNELDERPVPIKMVDPILGYDLQKNGGEAMISLIVDRDGTPKELKVESTTDAEFGRRCLAAAAQWRFKPGTINGSPVRTRVSVPFKL
jgi:TonB family protein